MISAYLLVHPTERDILSNYLSKYIMTHEVGWSSPNFSFLEKVNAVSPTFVFADANLVYTQKAAIKDLSRTCVVIFVSDAYEYAFDAFEVGGFDFLFAPFSYERFKASIDKFVSLSLKAPIAKQKVKALSADRFLVREGNREGKEVTVKFKQILCIEAVQNKVVIRLHNGKGIPSNFSLKDMEEFLPAEKFVRVHKSFLINYDMINIIEGSNIILGEEAFIKITVGTSYRQKFTDFKNNFLPKRLKKAIDLGVYKSLTA